MYEQATVLDYEGKKIWIKHIEKYFYCVNGRYIGFSSKQDLSEPVVVATALDEFYGPWYNNVVNESSVIVFRELRDGYITTNHCHLSDISFDINRVNIVRHEYDEWCRNIDSSDVYIDDCRTMDLGEWINREDAKYERAGL